MRYKQADSYGVWNRFMLSKKEQFPKIDFDNITKPEIFFILEQEMLNLLPNRILWETLPDNVPTWFIEQTLLFNGMGVFYKDEVMNEICFSPCVLQGDMNIYGLLSQRRVITPNATETNLILTEENSVLVFDNYMFIPIYNNIIYRIKILTEIMYAYLQNIGLQKNSIILLMNQNTKLSMDNLALQIMEGGKIIKMNDNFNPDSIKPVDLQVEFKADKLRIQYQEVKNELLNSLGIEAYSSNKRERETSAEGQGNLGFVEMCRNSIINPREQSLEQCKKLWPDKFSDSEVKFNTHLKTIINMPVELFNEFNGTDVPESEGDVNV